MESVGACSVIKRSDVIMEPCHFTFAPPLPVIPKFTSELGILPELDEESFFPPTEHDFSDFDEEFCEHKRTDITAACPICLKNRRARANSFNSSDWSSRHRHSLSRHRGRLSLCDNQIGTKAKLSRRSKVIQKTNSRRNWARCWRRCSGSHSRLHRMVESLCEAADDSLCYTSTPPKVAPRDRRQIQICEVSSSTDVVPMVTRSDSPESGLGSDVETLSRQSSLSSVYSITSSASTESGVCLQKQSQTSLPRTSSEQSVMCLQEVLKNELSEEIDSVMNMAVHENLTCVKQRTMEENVLDSQTLATTPSPKTSTPTKTPRTPVRTPTTPERTPMTPSKTPKTPAKTPRRKTPVVSTKKTPKTPTGKHSRRQQTPKKCTPISTPRKALVFGPKMCGSTPKDSPSHFFTPRRALATSTPLSGRSNGHCKKCGSGDGKENSCVPLSESLSRERSMLKNIVPTASDFIPKRRLSVGEQIRRRLTDGTPRLRRGSKVYNRKNDSKSTPRRRFTPNKRKVRLLSCLSSPSCNGTLYSK